MRVVGIDPGLTGGVALIDSGTLQEVVDIPVADKRVNVESLAFLLRKWNPEWVALEKTQAMPKNGSIASYSLGLSTGTITGIVGTLSYPLFKMRPIEWKRENGLVGKDKHASRALASELWPKHAAEFRRVRDDGRAEAALIARAAIYKLMRGDVDAVS